MKINTVKVVLYREPNLHPIKWEDLYFKAKKATGNFSGVK
jgi:hypothetical protein